MILFRTATFLLSTSYIMTATDWLHSGFIEELYNNHVTTILEFLHKLIKKWQHATRSNTVPLYMMMLMIDTTNTKYKIIQMSSMTRYQITDSFPIIHFQKQQKRSNQWFLLKSMKNDKSDRILSFQGANS